MNQNQQFLENLYEAFNQREIETVISFMQPDVKWANGIEGGFVHGRNQVREYWQHQFDMIQPQLQMLKFETDEANRSVVTVRQTIRDLEGNLLLEKTVDHIFTIENGLISAFELGNDEPFLERISPV